MAAQEYYNAAAAETQSRPPYPSSPPQRPQSWTNPSPSGTAPPPYEALSPHPNTPGLQQQTISPTRPSPPQQHNSSPGRPPLPHQQGSQPARVDSHHVSFAVDKRPHSQPPPQAQSGPTRQPSFYQPPAHTFNNGYPTPPPTGYPPQHPQQSFPPQQQPYPPPQQSPFPGQQYLQQTYPPPQGQGAYFPPPPHGGRPQSNSNPPQPQFLHPNQTHSYGPSGQAYPIAAARPTRYSKSHSPRPHSRSESSSRSRSRDRDGNRKHRHHKHHNSDDARGKKKGDKGTTDSFLGAGLGGIIGDAIFPGLGTVGGALLGGYGGHKYGEGKDARRDARAARRYSENRGRRKEWD